MKTCIKCKETKSMAYFNKIGDKKTGKIYYRNTCRRCSGLKNKIEKCYPRQRKLRYGTDYRTYSRILNTIRRSIYRIQEFKLNPKRKLKPFDIDLMSRFELMFEPKMSWDNYKEYWLPDHIIPLLKLIRQGISEEDLIDINNLRPVTVEFNRQRLRKAESEYKVSWI